MIWLLDSHRKLDFNHSPDTMKPNSCVYAMKECGVDKKRAML
jgi:hypothetical protein